MAYFQRFFPFLAPNSLMSMFSTAASFAASAMLVRTIAETMLPHHLQHYLFSALRCIFHRFFSKLTIVIDEFSGLSINDLYAAAEVYLTSIVSRSPANRLCVSKLDRDKDLSVSMDRGETVVDTFQGVKLEWLYICHESEENNSRRYDRYGRDISDSSRQESHSFHLTFDKKHKDDVLQAYLPHVLARAKAIKDENRTLKLHTVHYDMVVGGGSTWKSVNLNHPSTFSTLAMDAGAKEAVMEDLVRFVGRKEYYRRVGKAWKRGYLLYGPPGTGKSSLVAAMANFLNFDVYDLEMTDIAYNSTLRRILMSTANRSILVIEDIDCTLDFNRCSDDPNQRTRVGTMPPMMGRYYRGDDTDSRVTLSGLLNFIDGLWSSCGDERIIVFTTNHKDKLDPALLRPGRMDMHIHMSYCTFAGFKTLAKNYLAVDDHPLFEDLKQLIAEVEVTPAQVAEELMKSDDPEAAFGGFVEFLKGKKVER